MYISSTSNLDLKAVNPRMRIVHGPHNYVWFASGLVMSESNMLASIASLLDARGYNWTS